MLNGILVAFSNSLPIFVTIAIAIWLRYKKLLPQNTREVLRLIIFKVMIPFLVFKVLYGLKLGPENIFLIVTCLVLEIALLCVLFIGGRIFKLKRITQGTLMIAVLAFSVGPFGYPFAQLNFSKEVFQNLVLVDIILFMFLLIVGPLLGTYYDEGSKFDIKEILRKLIRDPILLTMVFTFALTYLNVQVPAFILNVSDYISKGFTFMAIFLVGISLQLPKKHELRLLVSMYTFRVLMIIIVTMLIFMSFAIPTVQKQALILAFFTPFSTFTLLYTEEYKLNSTLISQLSVFSIIVSLFVYPIMIAYIQTIN